MDIFSIRNFLLKTKDRSALFKVTLKALIANQNAKGVVSFDGDKVGTIFLQGI